MAFSIFIITLLLSIAHLVLIENYRRWFMKLKPFIPSAYTQPAITFSVIIPARNEEENIKNCLLTILQQSHPEHLFQVIVVDDYSTDYTALIVQALQKQYANLVLIQLEKELHTKQLNSYKKKAIEVAIQHATGTYIVTTDADCTVHTDWLQTFNAFILQTNAVFVAAPVRFIDTGSFVSKFQCLDFLSLQGITAASVAAGLHSMCNGANLAYSKASFVKAGGFKGIDNIASGDDMMLMHKIYKKYPGDVHFLYAQNAVVQTKPMPGWKDFFNQRIRWASKADKFDDKRIIVVLALVYVFNFSLVILPVAAIWYSQLWPWWLIMIVAKTLVELRFMLPVAAFFREEKLLRWFPVMQPFHIAYTIIAGWLGKFGKYKWKGREVR